MKIYIILGLFFLSVAFSSCSKVLMLQVFNGKESKWTEVKSNEVPPLILATFVEKYPGISVDKWYQFSNNRYAASFVKNYKKTIALFSASGIFQDEDLNFQDDYYDEYDGYWDYDNFD